MQLKEGLDCPEPVVVNFDEKDASAESIPEDPLATESVPEKGTTGESREGYNEMVTRGESLSKLGKRIGAWMKGEPRGIPSLPVSEIHVISRAPEKLEAGSATDADDDRSSLMMGDSERSVGSSAAADAQGSKIWAWLRAAAHPDARSVMSEPDAAEMRAADPDTRASDPEVGNAPARVEGDSSGEASFWKKRIFGRSLSTATFNSPPPADEQRQLRRSWAAVSY